MRKASRTRGLKAGAALLLLAAAFSGAHAQSTTNPPVQVPDEPRVYRTTGSRIAIGRNIQIARDEEVNDVVIVIGGSLRVDGRVRDGLVVVGGDVALGPGADVRGDVVLVGGQLTRENGATLRGSVSDISFGDWGSWSLGGFYLPRVEFGNFGRWLSLLGAMFRISLLAILMAMTLIVARAPVARIGRAAAASPAAATPITINVQAMDSRSFLDHSGEIAQAVREALLHSHALSDVVTEL